MHITWPVSFIIHQHKNANKRLAKHLACKVHVLSVTQHHGNITSYKLWYNIYYVQEMYSCHPISDLQETAYLSTAPVDKISNLTF